MAVAMVYPEPKRGMHSQYKNCTGNDVHRGVLFQARKVLRWEPAKTKRKGSGSLEIKELNAGYISQARTVLRYSEPLRMASQNRSS